MNVFPRGFSACHDLTASAAYCCEMKQYSDSRQYLEKHRNIFIYRYVYTCIYILYIYVEDGLYDVLENTEAYSENHSDGSGTEVSFPPHQSTPPPRNVG